MTPADYAKARRVLMRRDPVLKEIIRACGACGLADAQHTDPFKALVHAIVSQQLSGKAAATIAARFEALFNGHGGSAGPTLPTVFPTPAQVVAMPEQKLRGAGLSGMKVSFIRDLCRRVLDGSLRLDALDSMTDDEVIAALTEVKGIGRWTAEMFLMFRLHRPDVLPVGDLGIVKAMQKAYRLRALPSASRMERIGEAWRPYRSVACWYLWASLENRPLSD